MNFGKLDRQIEIESYVSTRSESGSFDKTWTSLGMFWAKADFKTGGERFETNQETSFKVLIFIIRFCKDLAVNEQMRIKYKNEYYDILAIDEIERNKYQSIEAKRKTVYQEL